MLIRRKTIDIMQDVPLIIQIGAGPKKLFETLRRGIQKAGVETR